MNRILFVFLLICLICCGCVKRKVLSPEEEYRLRQERRRREEQRRMEETTSLSGLNGFEVEALRRAKAQDDINPEPGSFVYSPHGNGPHSSERAVQNLNDNNQRNVQDYKKSVRQKRKSGSSWVYGF